MGNLFAETNLGDGTLNQKTNFQGTGTEIAAISPTYAGMKVFCTSTGSGFTADKYYYRNAANTAWIEEGVSDTSNITIDGVTDTLKNWLVLGLGA